MSFHCSYIHPCSHRVSPLNLYTLLSSIRVSATSLFPRRKIYEHHRCVGNESNANALLSPLRTATEEEETI